jgi:hypothetical protein
MQGKSDENILLELSEYQNVDTQNYKYTHCLIFLASASARLFVPRPAPQNCHLPSDNLRTSIFRPFPSFI